MNRVHDDARLAGAYERGNEMPEESLRAWVGLIASHAPCPSPAVVEIGAGTGVDERRFPGEEEVVADFRSAGFALEEVTSLAQPVADGLAAYHARLTTRPQSKFTHLTPEEFRQGLAAMESAAREEATGSPRPVLERYDVAVFALS
ncbi:hypothetical protein GCM10009801_79830 [Streptomyces albiaxialis]|uniref:Class I SAM-dependent methyltransferase n=1 Tax=Streptomyces albiaxialis TaxID=329523 RepID=A0ABN2X488_9ACTN